MTYLRSPPWTAVTAHCWGKGGELWVSVPSSFYKSITFTVFDLSVFHGMDRGISKNRCTKGRIQCSLLHLQSEQQQHSVMSSLICCCLSEARDNYSLWRNSSLFSKISSGTLNSLGGLYSLGGPEWIAVVLICGDSCCGAAWYCGHQEVWNQTCSQGHVPPLTFFGSAAAFSGALSLGWAPVVWAVEPLWDSFGSLKLSLSISVCWGVNKDKGGQNTEHLVSDVVTHITKYDSRGWGSFDLFVLVNSGW